MLLLLDCYHMIARKAYIDYGQRDVFFAP